jgi:hypothetical protein
MSKNISSWWIDSPISMYSRVADEVSFQFKSGGESGDDVTVRSGVSVADGCNAAINEDGIPPINPHTREDYSVVVIR